MIEIKGLGKKYLIGHEHHSPHASLKEILSHQAKRLIDRLTFRSGRSQLPSYTTEEFWALEDLSVNIQQGDRIALLGRNGAGKSTLLKVLARITEPTHGKVTIHGRVSSLLEVGTGFHPELTGRENIQLNAAIMGMSYEEIKKKFDEIVAFADIEKFLDTPIKRYSSGMFMRLGFAIAAHLESEVLILDEVLAVGDAQFQEKCLKKMNEMGAEGRTLLFVSHNINSVLTLCNKGLFLEKGRLKAFEAIEQCVSQYMLSCPHAGLLWEGYAGDEHVHLYEASLENPRSEMGFFYHGEKTLLAMKFEILKYHPDLTLGFSIINAHHHTIARTHLCDHDIHHRVIANPGHHKLIFELDLDLFHPGEYQIKLECSLANKKNIINEEIFLKFAVFAKNDSNRQKPATEKNGISLGNRWDLA